MAVEGETRSSDRIGYHVEPLVSQCSSDGYSIFAMCFKEDQKVGKNPTSVGVLMRDLDSTAIRGIA